MMEPRAGVAFDHIARTARGQFTLVFHATVYRLLLYVWRMAGRAADGPAADARPGETMEELLAAFPFVGKYLDQMRSGMPAGISWEEGASWWERELIAWADGDGDHLPLRSLAAVEGMGIGSVITLMVAGLVEEDSRFGTLVAHLQSPLAFRRPSMEFIAQIMFDPAAPAGADRWATCQRLITDGYLEVLNPDAPRAEWLPRVPAILWDLVRGAAPPATIPWAEVTPSAALTGLDELVLPDALVARLRLVPALLAGGAADAFILRASPGSERRKVMGGVAKAMARGMIIVDAAARASAREAEHLGPLCTMSGALPVLAFDLAPGETAEIPPLAGYRGPIGVIVGNEGGLRGKAAERSVTMSIPLPPVDLRVRHWRQALGDHPTEDLSVISERFHLAGGHIERAAVLAIAHAALDARDAITSDDVRHACRALNRQLLDTLAAHLPTEGTWERLVVGNATAMKLAELDRRCRHRERLLGHLGPAFGSGGNRGVRALFSGPSGTGKTLAARLLAAELGMDLYRVDLAAVVNKYIGETEKNLNTVLTVAEELDVILLLDEGDALLGSRTAVKSSNDRYANLETNYLLQRLEHYEGIVVVTTNAGENIDTGFQRRMDVVIDFVPAGPDERLLIWRSHLPVGHAVDERTLEEVARRCTLGGGQIRNAAIHAALAALDSGHPVDAAHLLAAVESEYRKAGAVCPLSTGGRTATHGNGMQAFIDALSL